MKKIIGILLAALVAASIPALAVIPFASSSSGEALFEFDEMVAVDGAFVGTDNPIRGINGGGLAWLIDEGEARLDTDGELRVEVEGLVLAVSGANPVQMFFATLSCLESDGSGTTVDVANTDTATVPADAEGDAEIRENIGPLSTCVAPIVFVRGDLSSIPGNPFGNPVGPDPADPWFAISGF